MRLEGAGLQTGRLISRKTLAADSTVADRPAETVGYKHAERLGWGDCGRRRRGLGQRVLQLLLLLG